MRVELRFRAIMALLASAALAAGCGAGGEQAPVAQSDDRAAASQRIQERLEAYSAWEKEAMAAQQSELEALSQRMPTFDDLKEDAAKIVAQNPGDEAALMAINVVVRTNKVPYDKELGGFQSEGPEAQLEAQMAQHLLKHHVNRPEILQIQLKLDRFARVDFLQHAFEASRQPQVKGNFAAQLADYYFSQLDRPSLKDKERDALRQQAMYYVDMIKKDYADVIPALYVTVPRYMLDGQPPYHRGPGTPTLAELMDERIRVLDHPVGSSLPNLQAITVHGKKDSLENHRGKVLLVDVWATWCSTCKTEMPELVELKKEMKGQPFEIIGVSGDEDLSTLQAFLTKEQLPWVHWHAGETHEILQKLGAKGFPTYLVVDSKGVLRERTHTITSDSKTLIRELVEQAG